MKSVSIVFFYSKGVARKEFLPPGKTLNVTILRDSALNIAKTSRSRPPREAWKLHNDNEPNRFRCHGLPS